MKKGLFDKKKEPEQDLHIAETVELGLIIGKILLEMFLMNVVLLLVQKKIRLVIF